MSEQYYGVYRVLKGGKYRYVSRSATANKRLAESIAEDLTRGEVVTPTGATRHVKAYPHVARPIETAKKNPRTVESGELAIYAINNADLYRQRTQPILKNLKRKIAKGTYKADLALKLWKYAADDAAQRYAKEFGGVWHEMFSVADRKEAAKEMADHYAEELRENPRRRKSIRVKSNPRRKSRGRITAGEAAQILSGLEDDTADFHSLRSDEVQYLLDTAKEIGYRAPKNASGSKARYFYAYLQNRRTMRVRENPTARIHKPSQTRRRSGFPGYIVTFIRPGWQKHRRQYIGGGRRAYTVVYKRFAAAVFPTSDKAKNVVRTYRKWFDANRVEKVTILRTNEAASKFP